MRHWRNYDPARPRRIVETKPDGRPGPPDIGEGNPSIGYLLVAKGGGNNDSSIETTRTTTEHPQGRSY